jgi:hypothetical protein
MDDDDDDATDDEGGGGDDDGNMDDTVVDTIPTEGDDKMTVMTTMTMTTGR